MKKILLFSSLIIAGVTNAQVTLTQITHAPANGETYLMTTVTSTAVNPGASGNGVTWNYSTIAISTTNTAYSGVNSSNTTYTPANIVVNYGSESSYYQSTSTFLRYFGGNIIIATYPATITYTSGANYAVYPMSFGVNTTSAIGGSLSALGQAGTFNGNSNSTANGQGTLILPGITYSNILRVLTTQTINFSIPSALITGVLNQDTYNYYISGRKAPLLTIVTSTVNTGSGPNSSTITTIASNYLTAGPTGLNQNKQSITDLSVFPNPSTNVLNLTTQNKNAVSVDVIDITGKKLNTYNFANGLVNFNTSNLANGIYIYIIKDNNNQTLTTGKFSVSN